MTYLKLARSISFLAALTALMSCSKATVDLDRASSHPDNRSELQLVQYSASQQSTIERIAEIDRLLAAPLTGTPEDSDRRAALRAERNALLGNHPVATNPTWDQLQKSRTDAQAAREHQMMVDRLKADAERSKMSEQRQLQAQREQWEKEDRLSLRRQNGDFRPEAPPQNVYDIQLRNERTRVVQPTYP